MAIRGNFQSEVRGGGEIMRPEGRQPRTMAVTTNQSSGTGRAATLSMNAATLPRGYSLLTTSLEIARNVSKTPRPLMATASKRGTLTVLM